MRPRDGSTRKSFRRLTRKSGCPSTTSSLYPWIVLGTTGSYRFACPAIPKKALLLHPTRDREVLPSESLEAIRAVVNQDLAQFKETAQWAHSRAQLVIEEEVRRSSGAIREELQRDLNNARLGAAEVVQEVKETYEKPMARRDLIIMILEAVILFIIAFVMGRASARP